MERDEAKREEFREFLKNIPEEKLVYIDESGIDNRIYKEYGYAKRGKKIFADVCGAKKERISCIAGTCAKKTIAPLTFQGNCNTEVFNTWIDKILIPELTKGQTIILDNASFHKSEKTRELIESSGCFLKFLPPYSPDMNKQENTWAVMKNYAKNNLKNFSNNILDTVNAFFNSS